MYSPFSFGAVLVALLATCSAPPANSTEFSPFGTCVVTKGPSLSVVGVENSETLKLEDGTVVRLIGAMAPRKPLIALAQKQPPDDFKKTDAAHRTGLWPLADQARAALENLVLGHPVTLWSTRRGSTASLADFPKDRYGRVLAQVTVHRPQQTENAATRSQRRPVWLQAVLLRSGLARVYSATNARACVPQLLRHEAAARRSRKMLWNHASYLVRNASRPQVLTGLMHTFQVVEGRIRRVARYRNATYVNFGGQWRTDFTLVIEGRSHRFLQSNGLNIRDLEGQRVRVRGWIEARDGPMMRLTHPEQIERLEPNALPSTLYGSGALAAFDELRAGSSDSAGHVAPLRVSPNSDRSAGPSAATKAQILDQDRKRIRRRRQGRRKETRPKARRERTNIIKPTTTSEPLFLSM